MSPRLKRNHMNDRNLCRGWGEDDIRRLVLELMERPSEKCLQALTEIASHPRWITTEEIAENLGWESWKNVKATLSALARTTNAYGITDPGTDHRSWPLEGERGNPRWRLFMPTEAADVVLQTAGR
jgi:hypothetical protein